MKDILRISLIFVCAFMLFSCKDDSPSEAELNFDSPDSKPEDQGMDSQTLAKAFANFQKYSGVYSLVVMRNGKIVAEKYYNGKNKDSYSNIASVSKSFISALVGIAIRDKIIDSLNSKLYDYMPAYFENDPEINKRKITIENLLTMTAGLKSIHDASSDWLSIPDIAGYAIGLTLESFPGITFNYNTALTHILSILISRRSGKSTFDFAKEKLFDKIGITCQKWDKDLFGNYTGGTGMYFTTRDLAKFGNLYLNDGKYNGEEVVPSSWVNKTIKPFIKVETNYYYAYSWWSLFSTGTTTFFAEGYGGQYIFVFKDYNLVIAATSNPNAPENSSNIISREFFVSNILPAIKN